jgi:antitoxin component HigA of HigAB toxin-antitoxin module
MRHKTIIEVNADWDEMGKVWLAGSAQVSELSVEAPTLEELRVKVYATLVHLIEDKDNPQEIPIRIHAEHMGWLVV